MKYFTTIVILAISAVFFGRSYITQPLELQGGVIFPPDNEVLLPLLSEDSIPFIGTEGSILQDNADFNYNPLLDLLTATNVSSSIVTSTKFCLTGDNCITTWPVGGGSGTPGGNDTEIQFNNNDAFAGDSSFTFNSSTNQLTVTNVTGTSVTSTNLSVSGVFNFLGTAITNVSTWFNGLVDTYITGGTGITYSSGNLSFDCSEVEGTNINCDGENITLETDITGVSSLQGPSGNITISTAIGGDIVIDPYTVNPSTQGDVIFSDMTASSILYLGTSSELSEDANFTYTSTGGLTVANTSTFATTTFVGPVGLVDVTGEAQEAIEIEDADSDVYIATYSGSGLFAGIKMSERVDGEFGIAMYHDGTSNSLVWRTLTTGGTLGTLLMYLSRTTGKLTISNDLKLGGSFDDSADSSGISGNHLISTGTSTKWQYRGVIDSFTTDLVNFTGLGTTSTLPGAAVQNNTVIHYKTTVNAGTSIGSLSLMINGVSRCNIPHSTDGFQHLFDLTIVIDSTGTAEGYCFVTFDDDSTGYLHTDETFSVSLNTGSDNTFNVNSTVSGADHRSAYISVE